MNRMTLLVTLLVLFAGCDRVRNWWNVDLGSAVGEPCASSGDCEPGLSCAHDGTCQVYGEPGTFAPGEDCVHSEECGYGYVCASDWLCSEEGQPGTGGEGDACVSQEDCRIGFNCSDEGMCEDAGLPYWAGVSCEEENWNEPFRVFFEVPELPLAGETEFYRLPFPNDVRAVGDVLDLSGHPGPGDLVDGDPFGTHLEALEAAGQGFGLNPMVLFRFSQEHLVSSAVAFEGSADTIFYADVTEGSDTYGFRDSFAWRTAHYRSRYHCRNWLAVTVYPGFPLLPLHTYAVYLTSDIQSEDGERAQRDEDFDAVMGDERPTEDHLAQAWDVYAPFRDYLADKGIDGDGIVAASVFTTGDPAAGIRFVENRVEEAAVDPDPRDITLCDAGISSPCEGGDDITCEAANGSYHEIHGRLSVATLLYDVSGAAVEGSDTVCFGLTVPTGPAPADGWPVVVYGADDTESFRGAVTSGLADAFTSAEVDGGDPVAFATLTLDPLDRGAQRDQFQDSIAAVLGGWQAAADVHGAARLLDTWSDDGALTGDPIAFSATAQVFLGRGLGAEAGVLALANSDRFPAVVLASAGAYRTDAILHQQEPVELLATLQQTLADSTLDRFHPAVNLYQQFFDLADPVCSAEALVADTPLSRTPKHVLQVYGLWDDHTPEEAQQALQRALQIPTAGDVLVDFGQSTTTLPATSNLFTGSDYYTAASIQAGGGMDALLDPEILRQVEHFLATAVTEDVPTIPR